MQYLDRLGALSFYLLKLHDEVTAFLFACLLVTHRLYTQRTDYKFLHGKREKNPNLYKSDLAVSSFITFFYCLFTRKTLTIKLILLIVLAP